MLISKPLQTKQTNQQFIQAVNDPHASIIPPRMSAPVSFLPLRAFVLAMMMLTGCLLTGGNVANAQSVDCVCRYDPEVDYFPNKLSANYSANFAIEYRKSYKKMTARKNGVEYVTYAYLCGTPVPSEGNVNNTVQIPINSAAVTSTVFLPFFEYLGLRNTLHYVSTSATGFKPCLRKMYDEGKVADGFSLLNKLGQINASAYARTGEPLDVVFMDDSNYQNQALRSAIRTQLGARTKTVYIGEQFETTPMGKLEWVEFVAALYNKEYATLDVALRLETRYTCAKDLVADAPPTVEKKVLWGSCYYSSYSMTTDCYVAVCPNYYCGLISNAGATLLLAGKSKLTTSEMFTLAQGADVWIYTDGNWNTSTVYSPVFFNGSIAAQFSTLPAVQNKQVYDILGHHINDWFEDAKAEPGVLLLDLMQAIHGTRYVGSSRQKQFLRNVFTEPAAFQGERVASMCTNENATLYTGWLTGTCAVATASQLIVPNPDRPLCSFALAGVAGMPMTMLVGLVGMVAFGLVF